MTEYVHSENGKIFVLTEKGMADSRIRAKYTEGPQFQEKYQRVAPKRWLNEGFIKEKEI